MDMTENKSLYYPKILALTGQTCKELNEVLKKQTRVQDHPENVGQRYEHLAYFMPPIETTSHWNDFQRILLSAATLPLWHDGKSKELKEFLHNSHGSVIDECLHFSLQVWLGNQPIRVYRKVLYVLGEVVFSEEFASHPQVKKYDCRLRATCDLSTMDPLVKLVILCSSSMETESQLNLFLAYYGPHFLVWTVQLVRQRIRSPTETSLVTKLLVLLCASYRRMNLDSLFDVADILLTALEHLVEISKDEEVGDNFELGVRLLAACHCPEVALSVFGQCVLVYFLTYISWRDVHIYRMLFRGLTTEQIESSVRTALHFITKVDKEEADRVVASEVIHILEVEFRFSIT